jgi:hypothetical protein
MVAVVPIAFVRSVEPDGAEAKSDSGPNQFRFESIPIRSVFAHPLFCEITSPRGRMSGAHRGDEGVSKPCGGSVQPGVVRGVSRPLS